MNKETLKTIITDQRELMLSQLKAERIVGREGLAACEKFLSFPNVLLVSGLRRAGKSFFSSLLVNGKKYAYLNFDDERLVGFEAKELNLVLECFYELYDNFIYIILDEVQNVPGWELFVNRLRRKYRVIITGSNAHLLSSELATHLTGRFVSFTVFPLSFDEFLRYRAFVIPAKGVYSTQIKSRIAIHFQEYLKTGGIFEYYKFGEEFLRNLFSSILAKDIVSRYEIKHPVVLEELALLLANYFTTKVSLNNITKSLKIKSSHTTRQYLKHLESTFLFFSVNKFSYKLKEQLSAFKKIYVADNGLINSLVPGFSQNRGRLLENLVAIELLRRSLHNNFEFFYWDNYNVECDFVILKNRKIAAAYQVCGELTLQNKDRELNGLLNAMKEFGLKEGFILTESTEEDIKKANYKIKVLPAWKWLLG